MLRLFHIHPGGHRYYLAVTRSSAQRDSGLFEEEGRWLGHQARALGLEHDVAGADLAALFAGCDPSTGEVLREPTASLRNAAIDCVFAAPKSVSVLAALGAPATSRAVHEAHAAAVDAGIGYLEREGARVRRGGDRRELRCNGFAVAAFTHRASRAPDPHLHTHALVMNLGHGVDGRWSALDARALYLLRASAGALYEAELRAAMTERLGCAFRSRERAIDIEGVANTVVHEFSRRSRQIAGERIEGLERPAREKDLSQSYEDLVAGWTSRARGLGLSDATLAHLCDRVGPRSVAEQRVVTMRAAIRAVQRFRLPFRADELLTRTERVLVPGAPAPLLESCIADVLTHESRRVGRYGHERAIPGGHAWPRFVAVGAPEPEPLRPGPLRNQRVLERAPGRGDVVRSR